MNSAKPPPKLMAWFTIVVFSLVMAVLIVFILGVFVHVWRWTF